MSQRVENPWGPRVGVEVKTWDYNYGFWVKGVVKKTSSNPKKVWVAIPRNPFANDTGRDIGTINVLRHKDKLARPDLPRYGRP